MTRVKPFLAPAIHPSEMAEVHPQGQRLTAGELFREHGAFVAGFVSRLGVPRQELDDVVQDIFLVAHQRGGFVEGSARPNTWLAEIAFRVVSGRRRSARRKREDSDALALDHAVADAPGADARADSRQRLARVQRALETLDLTHRNVFVLFEIYGEPCDQIAAGLGIPVGTVYSRLHKARRQFSQAHAALTQGEVE